MEKIRIVLADDHEVVRRGIKMIFDDQEDIEIVGDVSSGDDARDKIEELLPDVLITDITMPKISGIELTKMISENYPNIKVLILSMHKDEEYIVKAIEAGARGYLSKNAERMEIIAAVRCIVRGEMYYTSAVAKIITLGLIRKFRKPGESKDLTQREIEILKCIVLGWNNKKIATNLNISPRTVDTHRSNIMKKLETKNTADLVRIAITRNLVYLNNDS